MLKVIMSSVPFERITLELVKFLTHNDEKIKLYKNGLTLPHEHNTKFEI